MCLSRLSFHFLQCRLALRANIQYRFDRVTPIGRMELPPVKGSARAERTPTTSKSAYQSRYERSPSRAVGPSPVLCPRRPWDDEPTERVAELQRRIQSLMADQDAIGNETRQRHERQRQRDATAARRELAVAQAQVRHSDIGRNDRVKKQSAVLCAEVVDAAAVELGRQRKRLAVQQRFIDRM